MTAAREASTAMGDLISEYRNHLVDLGRAESTIETYVSVLRRMDAELPVGLVSAHADELRDWINAGSRAKATRALYRTTAAGFFAWTTNPLEQRLDYDPTVLLPVVKVPRRAARPVVDDALADILARARQPFASWFTIAAYAGARCIEISALDREDVTEESMLLRGKGDKERVVPVHPLVWRAVRDLPRGPVARSADGGRATRQSVTWRGNRHLHRALGYRRVTMHMLRHWFATSVYEASGHDIRTTQDLLGHANISTTQGYVATSAPNRARAVLGLRRVA